MSEKKLPEDTMNDGERKNDQNVISVSPATIKIAPVVGDVYMRITVPPPELPEDLKKAMAARADAKKSGEHESSSDKTKPAP